MTVSVYFEVVNESQTRLLPFTFLGEQMIEFNTQIFQLVFAIWNHNEYLKLYSRFQCWIRYSALNFKFEKK